MTTIFYDARENKIAIDSRLTSGNIIETDEAKKYFNHVPGEIIFWSGDCNTAHLASKFAVGDKYDESLEFAFIVARESKVYARYVKDGTMLEYPANWSFGEGSGACFAMAAYDFGKNAKESVEYASTRDVRTGGDIRVFNVADMSFE